MSVVHCLQPFPPLLNFIIISTLRRLSHDSLELLPLASGAQGEKDPQPRRWRTGRCRIRYLTRLRHVLDPRVSNGV